jgi:hypothetical protein
MVRGMYLNMLQVHNYVWLERSDLKRDTFVAVGPNQPLPKLSWSFPPRGSYFKTSHMVFTL